MLLFVALILLFALLAIRFSDQSGLPSLLLFLALGILCSSLGIEFNDYSFSNNFSMIALIIIMFYGGFATNWKMGKDVFWPAASLASLGVALTALLTGLCIYFIFKLPLLESMLLGSIVGSTDYASVSNILTSKNLNLKYKTASLLELESGSNDPSAYTMTLLFLSLLQGKEIHIGLLIVKQIGLGLLFGFALSYLVKIIMQRFYLKKDGLTIVFIFAMTLLSYALADYLGGNGYLAVYIFGIRLGNQPFRGKRDIIYFFDGLSELMNIGLFFILGLLATPKRIFIELPIALGIMLVMTFLTRPVTIFSLMLPFRLKLNQLIIISWAGLRGAAAIAFAIFAISSNLNFGIDIYHIVFGICFLSSLFQGSLMAPLAKKLDMLDANDTVLRTFNYYVDKGNISFIKATIDEKSILCGKTLQEMNLAGNFIIAKIVHNGKAIVPKGNITLQAGDEIILSGEEYFDPRGQDLIEFSLTENHPWLGKELKNLHIQDNQLILFIFRKDEFIVAEGKSQLQVGDRVILYQGQEGA